MQRDIDPKDLEFRKSSFSYANGDCVEVARLPDGGVAVRDSTDPGIVLTFTTAQGGAFLNGVRCSEFNF